MVFSVVHVTSDQCIDTRDQFIVPRDQFIDTRDRSNTSSLPVISCVAWEPTPVESLSYISYLSRFVSSSLLSRLPRKATHPALFFYNILIKHAAAGQQPAVLETLYRLNQSIRAQVRLY